MFVTSKRCFVNVLAQFMDLETLLNASYYIADVRSRNGSMMFDQNLRYNEEGQLVVEQNPSANSIPAFTKYNIRYGNGDLDPSPYITTQLISGGDQVDPEEAFVRRLSQTETYANVYDFLYGEKPKGNGLRILVYYDDDTIKHFAHVVCLYLSKNFGEDITFIDPQYRPDIRGQAFYPGDKEYAKKTFQDIQDYLLLTQFNQAITSMGYDESVNNLLIWLNAFEPNQLMHLYEIIFPNDPLPPGNYTTDHIKQIIVGRVSDTIPKNQTILPNLYTTDAYLQSLHEQLEDMNLT